jgi:hypothetical protein
LVYPYPITKASAYQNWEKLGRISSPKPYTTEEERLDAS